MFHEFALAEPTAKANHADEDFTKNALALPGKLPIEQEPAVWFYMSKNKTILCALVLVIGVSFLSLVRSCRPPPGGKENFILMGTRLGEEVSQLLKEGDTVLMVAWEGDRTVLDKQVGACAKTLKKSNIQSEVVRVARATEEEAHYEFGMSAAAFGDALKGREDVQAVISFIGMPDKFPPWLSVPVILVGVSVPQGEEALKHEQVALVYAYRGTHFEKPQPNNPEEWFDMYCTILKK